MIWLHDVSQLALAGAVLALGLVILLELRSLLRLRQAVDSNLARVFEQLDLLRFENQQLMEGQAQAQGCLREAAAPLPAVRPGMQSAGVAVAERAAPAGTAVAGMVATAISTTGTTAYQNAAALAASGMAAREIADRCGLAAGEVRLLSSLAQARARREATRA